MMMTNWGDISNNLAADQEEMRLREKQLLRNAEHAGEDTNPLTAIAHTVRNRIARPRPMAQSAAKLETREMRRV